MKKFAKICCIGCFLGILFISAILTITSEKETISYYENRMLAAFPEYTKESLLSGEYPAEISSYLKDHFAGREAALRAGTWMNLYILQKPVVNDVVVRDDILLPYLPFAEVPTEESTQKKAEAMADTIAAAAKITEENGGKYCYVMVPCQYAMFPDKYPDYLYNRQGKTEQERKYFKEALTERGVTFVDMGDIFAEQENPAQYSSAIDNHYSLQGAFLTYTAIADTLEEQDAFTLQIPEGISFTPVEKPYLGSRNRKLFGLWQNGEQLYQASFPEEIPFTRTDNGINVPPFLYKTPEDGRNEILYQYYMGGDIAETILQTNRAELPRGLIYGDSFTNALEVLAYSSFDEMRSLDYRYYNQKSLEEYLQEYQPDVVICVRDYEAMLSPDGNGKAVTEK